MGDDDDRCGACRHIMRGPCRIGKCGHYFCKRCIDRLPRGLERRCPRCGSRADQLPQVDMRRVMGIAYRHPGWSTMGPPPLPETKDADGVPEEARREPLELRRMARRKEVLADAIRIVRAMDAGPFVVLRRHASLRGLPLMTIAYHGRPLFRVPMLQSSFAHGTELPIYLDFGCGGCEAAAQAPPPKLALLPVVELHPKGREAYEHLVRHGVPSGTGAVCAASLLLLRIGPESRLPDAWPLPLRGPEHDDVDLRLGLWIAGVAPPAAAPSLAPPTAEPAVARCPPSPLSFEDIEYLMGCAESP